MVFSIVSIIELYRSLSNRNRSESRERKLLLFPMAAAEGVMARSEKVLRRAKMKKKKTTGNRLRVVWNPKNYYIYIYILSHTSFPHGNILTAAGGKRKKYVRRIAKYDNNSGRLSV